MRYHEIIEARRNPEQNPKLSVYEQIKDYLNDPNIYISFTTINKIGINPQSTYATPNGIYAYPLKRGIDYYNIDVEKNGVFNQFPFASDAPYAQLFKHNSSDNLIMLDDSYTQEHYEQDLRKLHYLYNSGPREKPGFDTFVKKVEEDTEHKTTARLIWNLTRWASTNWGETRFHNPNGWNKVFRHLGYDGAVDNEGRGIIHPGEPVQAVFFSLAAITPIIRVEHNRVMYNRSTYDKYAMNRNLKSLSFATDVTEITNSDQYSKFVSDVCEMWNKIKRSSNLIHTIRSALYQHFDINRVISLLEYLSYDKNWKHGVALLFKYKKTLFYELEDTDFTKVSTRILTILGKYASNNKFTADELLRLCKMFRIYTMEKYIRPVERAFMKVATDEQKEEYHSYLLKRIKNVV